MTPADFVDVVVIPAVRDLFERPVDLRRMYVACIVTDHITEHIAFAANKPRETIRDEMRAACGTTFDVVRGIAIARKHPDSASAKRYRAGEERVAPAFGFGEATEFVNGQPTWAGFGIGSFGPPRLYVVEDGEKLIIDSCVRTVLLGYVATFPTQLGTIDVSWMQPPPAPADNS